MSSGKLPSMSAISCRCARSRPSAATDARRSRQAAPRGCKRGGSRRWIPLSRAHRDRGPRSGVFPVSLHGRGPVTRRLRAPRRKDRNGGPLPLCAICDSGGAKGRVPNRCNSPESALKCDRHMRSVAATSSRERSLSRLTKPTSAAPPPVQRRRGVPPSSLGRETTRQAAIGHLR